MKPVRLAAGLIAVLVAAGACDGASLGTADDTDRAEALEPADEAEPASDEHDAGDDDRENASERADEGETGDDGDPEPEPSDTPDDPAPDNADIDDDPPEPTEEAEPERPEDDARRDIPDEPTNPQPRFDPIAIPDRDPTGVEVTRYVTDAGPAAVVRLVVTVEHPFAGDLTVYLWAPDGTGGLVRPADGRPGTTIAPIVARAPFVGVEARGLWRVRTADVRGGDEGRLVDVRLEVDIGAADTDEADPERTAPEIEFVEPPADRPEGATAIPDADPAGITRTVILDDGAPVSGVCADVAVQHPFVGDLRVTLTSPTGTTAVLAAPDRANGAEGFAAPLRSAAFAGEARSGTWTLTVVDTSAGDAGVFVSWTLDTACFLPPPPADDDTTEAEDPPPARGTCDTPLALPAANEVRRGLLTGASALSPPAACSSWPLLGPEDVYRMDATAGRSVTIDVRPTGFDATLYILGACAPNTPCTAVAEAAGVGGAERIAFRPAATGTYYLVVDSDAQRPGGPYTLTVAECPFEGRAAATGLPVPIPSRTSTPVEVTINVPGSFTVQRVDIEVDITHGFPPDLRVVLRSPDGTAMTLLDRNAAPTGGVQIRRAAEPAFVGKRGDGRWLLAVEDLAFADSGSIRAFALTFGCH